MVYSKKIVKVDIGDTVFWKSTKPGHNVEFIKGGVPQGEKSPYHTMGGGTYDSGKMNEVLSSQYSDTMNGQQSVAVNPNDPMAKFLNKDYRQVMQKVEEKARFKNGA